MAFSVTGTIGDNTYTVTWNRGELSGDPEALALVQREAERLEGKLVSPTPTGPFTETNHLSNALSAAVIIWEMFDVVVSTKGRVPVAPSVPPGALA